MGSTGWKIAVALSWLLIISAGGVWGQCVSCRWADRGDRFEGIAKSQKSGGCCDLLGVHYKRADRITETADKLYLHFWLPAEGTPEIVVWQPDLNYLMVPKSKHYGKGLQRFAWPRQEVLAPLGVKIDSLYVRVSNGARIHFPTLLSTSEKPVPSGTYAFILESGGPLDIRCTIEREEKGRLMPVRSFSQTEDFGGTFTVEWDGRDDKGGAVPGGVYVLRLKGRLEAERIQRIDYTVSFQHYDRFQ